MKPLANIPLWAFKVLLTCAACIWGFSFVLMKDVVEVLPPSWLLGFRFLAASALLFVFLARRVLKTLSWRIVAAGLVLGLFDFLGFWFQTVGLTQTTPGINAFLTATYCVIVPFAWWLVARRAPAAYNVAAAALAVAGIWFVAVSTAGEQLTFGFGEGMTLICAVAFAFHLVFVSRFAEKHDVLVLTALQFFFEGLMACCVGAVTETLPALDTVAPEIWGQLAFLAVFASVVAFGIQNVGLAYVPPAQGALFLSLESVFGVLFSILLYGEVMTVQLVFGFCLIFGGVILNEVVGPHLRGRWRAGGAR